MVQGSGCRLQGFGFGVEDVIVNCSEALLSVAGKTPMSICTRVAGSGGIEGSEVGMGSKASYINAPLAINNTPPPG